MALLGLAVSSCTMQIPSPDVIINEVKDDQSGGGGDLTPESLQAPVVSPSTLNSSNGDIVAVSLNLPPNSPIGTVIHYTLDGSDPTTSITASLYTTPLTVSGNSNIVVVRAAAFDGIDYSTSSTGAYWFGDWEVVGDNYIEKPSSKSFVAENGILYVAKTDESVVPNRLVIQFTSAGSPWTELPPVTAGVDTHCVGNPWFGGNYTKAMDVESGIVYVACNNLNGVLVKKYQNGAWVDIIGTTNPIAPIEDPVDITLKVSQGIPFVAGVDHGNWKARAYYFDGTDWKAMGPQPLMPNSINRIGFDVINRIPYVVYAEVGGLVVKKYDIDNDTWTSLGSGAISIANAYYSDISVDDNGTTEGVPYVMFKDINNDFRMMKYENNSWTYIGGTSPESWFMKVHNGIPYVSTLAANKIIIKRFFGGIWKAVGTATYYSTGQFDTSIEVDPTNGNIYTYYQLWGETFGIAESFGPNGSNITSHIEDPLGCPGC